MNELEINNNQPKGESELQKKTILETLEFFLHTPLPEQIDSNDHIALRMDRAFKPHLSSNKATAFDFLVAKLIVKSSNGDKDSTKIILDRLEGKVSPPMKPGNKFTGVPIIVNLD